MKKTVDVDTLLADFRRINASPKLRKEAIKCIEDAPIDPAKELCRAIPRALRRKGIPLRPQRVSTWNRLP